MTHPLVAIALAKAAETAGERLANEAMDAIFGSSVSSETRALEKRLKRIEGKIDELQRSVANLTLLVEALPDIILDGVTALTAEAGRSALRSRFLTVAHLQENPDLPRIDIDVNDVLEHLDAAVDFEHRPHELAELVRYAEMARVIVYTEHGPGFEQRIADPFRAKVEDLDFEVEKRKRAVGQAYQRAEAVLRRGHLKNLRTNSTSPYVLWDTVRLKVRTYHCGSGIDPSSRTCEDPDPREQNRFRRRQERDVTEINREKVIIEQAMNEMMAVMPPLAILKAYVDRLDAVSDTRQPTPMVDVVPGLGGRVNLIVSPELGNASPNPIS